MITAFIQGEHEQGTITFRSFSNGFEWEISTLDRGFRNEAWSLSHRTLDEAWKGASELMDAEFGTWSLEVYY